jgi:isochorismate pyruvate lyase
MPSLQSPETCQSMAELRVQIDAIDVELVGLLVTRTSYIDRAADLKKIEGLPARTTDRVAEVLDKVTETASQLGLDPDLARALWTELIEWSIRRESTELGG